jgi:NAD(P)H-hydrate epimerase
LKINHGIINDMKLISAEQMQAMDRRAIDELGLPGALLMENAGRAAAVALVADAQALFPGPVLVLAGAGNNGGDGYVVARILQGWGWQVTTLVLAAESRIGGDAALMLRVLQRLGSTVIFTPEIQDLRTQLDLCTPRLVIDALLGTGLNTEVRGFYRDALELVAQIDARVLALDLPSGVNASDGRVMGRALKADQTLSFHHAKIGHGTRPGSDYVGDLKVLDIGIPYLLSPAETAEAEVVLLDPASARQLLPIRSARGHKGTFGHLTVVAGAPGYTGAAVLTSQAGLRSGAGLTTLLSPPGLYPLMAQKLTEVMTRPLNAPGDCLTAEHCEEIMAFAAQTQALVVGPGLGRQPQTIDAVRHLLGQSTCPLVLDADALNALVGATELLTTLVDSVPVLTPHPGEFARLLGCSIADVEADRFRLARRFAVDFGVVLLLKGARTLIADPLGRVRISPSGNAGLATAGSGDVLAGLIGGLLAQGLNSFDAASLGAWLHGSAADLLAAATGTAGLMATDLLNKIPLARFHLEGAQPC